MKSILNYINESNITKDVLVNDYNNSEYATGNEKKELANKYNAVNKIKDIKHAILLKLRDERNTRNKFDSDDLKWFSRFDFSDRDFPKYLAEEPIEFVRFLATYYLEDLKKRKLDKYITMTSFSGYSFSPNQKYMIKRYQTILSFLNENDKTDDEKMKAKADKERLANMMKLAVEKLHEQLKGFKKQLMDHVKNQAQCTYNKAPENLNKLMEAIKKYDEMDYRELMRGYNYKEREGLKKRIGNLKAILRMSKTEFVNKNLEAAESQYNSDVNTLADKIHDKGLDIENIECTHITQDPKCIEMVITDGNKKLYCRSIIAAEYSDKMVAHFRFIITERK